MSYFVTSLLLEKWEKWPEKRRANGPCLRFVNRICYLISGVLLLYCTAGEYFLYLFTVSNYRERQ